MERQFKVYVYEDGEPPVFHHAPCDGILGMEGIFINQMEISQFRTKNPNNSHVYFLPFSVVSIVHFVYVVDSHAWGPMKNTAADYVKSIASKYPHWNRSLGADHFMLACHDWVSVFFPSILVIINDHVGVYLESLILFNATV